MNELGLLPFILVCILSILFKVLNAKVKMTMLYTVITIYMKPTCMEACFVTQATKAIFRLSCTVKMVCAVSRLSLYSKGDKHRVFCRRQSF